MPQELIDQLAQPGRLFIPVGTGVQEIIQVDKDDQGNIQKKRLFGVMVRGFCLPIPLNSHFPPVRPPNRPGHTESVPLLKYTLDKTCTIRSRKVNNCTIYVMQLRFSTTKTASRSVPCWTRWPHFRTPHISVTPTVGDRDARRHLQRTTGRRSQFSASEGC